MGEGTVKSPAGACEALRFSATSRRNSSMPFAPRTNFNRAMTLFFRFPVSLQTPSNPPPGQSPGPRASSAVAPGVAASLARSKSRIGQQAHGGAHVFELHEMELNVFARGQVAAPGRVFARNARQDSKLRRLEHARGNFDS